MIPWVKEQIADAWHNSRKSSRTSKKGSLSTSSTNDSGKTNSGTIISLGTSSNAFNIVIVSLEGEVMAVPVKPDLTIEKLKILAVKHFYGSDGTKSPSKFHLVHADKMRKLVDKSTVTEEEIHENDELLMVEKRSTKNKEIFDEEESRGPTTEEIMRATSHLPEAKIPKITPTNDCPADFQAEIRKILITLVQASAKILTSSSEAEKAYEILREKLELRYKPTYDPKTVKYLMDIGFTEKKVLKALCLRKMNVSEALDWLIEHHDDPDSDEDFQLPAVDLDELIGDKSAGSTDDAGKSMESVNLIKIVDLLLESFHQYKRLEFKPNPRIKGSLIEMGFDEKNVIDALKITGNNQSNACEWLLGARRKSLQDLDEGLDQDGPIYSAIMNNPHIQLSLTNPKMLIAYLSIIETPSSTSVWINDPEVSPVLSQIFKTYHSEKHAIHMNRYEFVS